jgi:hypothetical protein
MQLRGLFVSGDGISIRRIREAPPMFPALTHKRYLRTGIDLSRRICVFEEQAQPLRNLAAAYRSMMAESEYGLDQMTASLGMALQERRNKNG